MQNRATLIKTLLLALMLFLSTGLVNAKNHPSTVKNIAVRPARQYGTLADKNIKYFGRWDFSKSDQYVSAWGGAYIKVIFTGTTAKLKVGNTSNFYAKIDNGEWTGYMKAGGTIDLTPTPLSKGKHSLIVMQGKDYNYLFNFQGLILDEGAVTKSPKVSSTLIEYIGDSITCGYTDPQSNLSCYARVCSDALGTEHTQIAYPGITLANGYPKTGMATQYFKLQCTNNPTPSPDWDFTQYTPKIVVINLGTNDNNKKVLDTA